MKKHLALHKLFDRIWLIFILYFIIGFIIQLPCLTLPMGDDEAVYMTVGREAAHGQILYKDVWDNKPPYTLLFYTLFYGLTGGCVPVFRILSVLLLSASALLLRKILLSINFTARLSTVFGALFLLSLELYRTTFNATVLQLPFLMAGCLFLKYCYDRGKAVWALPAGLLFGISVNIKQTIVFQLTLICIIFFAFAFKKYKIRGLSICFNIFIGGVISILPIAAYVYYNNIANDFYLINWLYNTAYSAQRTPSGAALLRMVIELLTYKWADLLTIVFPLSMAGGALYIYKRGWKIFRLEGSMDMVFLFSTAIFIGVIPGAVMGGGMHRHYFITSLPGLLILLAMLFQTDPGEDTASPAYDIMNKRNMVVIGVLAGILFLSNLEPYAFFFIKDKERENLKSQVNKLYAAQSNINYDDRYLFVWGGYDPKLFVELNARPASRVTYSLFLFKDRRKSSPEADRFYDYTWKCVSEDLHKRTPNIIVDVSKEFYGKISEEERDLFDKILVNYDVAFESDNYVVYTSKALE